MPVKKKIVLFDSNIRYVGVPLALLSITRLLNVEKYDIHIITKTAFPDYEDEILKQCDGALCFGVTCITGTPIKHALKISELVKKHYPLLPVIWGGWQPTTLPEVTLNNPNVDYICTGQGERTFLEFINFLESQDDDSIDKIRGLSYKQDGIIKHNAKRELEDPNLFPDYDLRLINWGEFLEVTDYGTKTLRSLTSYGCAYRCGFCCEPLQSERRWKSFTADRVIDFLKNLRQVVYFDSLVIVDSNFFTNQMRVVKFCEGLLENNFNIRLGQVNGRVNELILYKEESWELLRRAGFYQILIGAESASNETLKLINKDGKVEDTVELVKIASRHNIMLVVSTILGLPLDAYFTKNRDKAFNKELIELFGLYKNLNKINPKTLLLTFVYTPLPFSPMYNKVIELGFVPPKTLEEWASYEITDIHIDWISQKNLAKVQMLNYTCGTMSIDFSYIMSVLPFFVKWMALPVVSLAKFICYLRLKFGILFFPLDMKLFYWGLTVFKKMNRSLNFVNIGD